MKPVLVILSILAAPVGAAAQTAPTTAASSLPAPSPAALQLARTIASDANVLSQVQRVLHEQTPKTLAANPEFQALEKRWPGFTGQFIDTLEPIIVRYTRARLPGYQGKVAALFTARMSPQEIAATTAFYGSPAGARVLALMIQGTDYSAMLQRQIESGGTSEVKGEDIHAAVMPGVGVTLSKLTPDDFKALMTFGVSPAGRKLNDLNPDLQALAAENANDRDPAMKKDIETAVTALAQQRMATQPKK